MIRRPARTIVQALYTITLLPRILCWWFVDMMDGFTVIVGLRRKDWPTGRTWWRWQRVVVPERDPIAVQQELQQQLARDTEARRTR